VSRRQGRKHHHGRHKKNHPSGVEENLPSDALTVSSDEPRREDSQETIKQNEEPPKMTKRPDWMTIFTGVLALFAILSFGALWIQLQDARGNFIKDQRPFIWLTNNLGSPTFLRPPDSTGPEGYVIWDWHFTNYGKTPARDIHFNHGMQIGDNALAKARDFVGPDKMGAPLPPNKDDFSTSFFKTKISPNEFQRLMNTEETIVVYGRFTYTDASGEKYETGFCMYHLKSGPISYCPDQNSNYIK
jgi:hypothetical protein